MHFTKKLRTSVLTLGIVGASLFVACKPHNEPDNSGKPTTQDTITNTQAKKRNIELYFKRGYFTDLFADSINHYLAKPDVDTIFMVPKDGGGFQEQGASTLHALHTALQIKTDIDSTRIWGRGNLEFMLGVVAETDSLWFVSRGWTLNKQLQNQR